MRNAEDLPETGCQQRPLAEKEPGTLLSRFEFEFQSVEVESALDEKEKEEEDDEDEDERIEGGGARGCRSHTWRTSHGMLEGLEVKRRRKRNELIE